MSNSSSELLVVDVIMPSLSYKLLSAPICLLIACNLLTHYYYVCTIAPGFLDAPPQLPGSNYLWAKPKSSSRALAGANKLNITPANVTTCRKCGERKPEVSL